MKGTTESFSFLRVCRSLYWWLLAILVALAALAYIPQTTVYIRLFQLAGGAYLGILSPLGWFALLLGYLMANLWWLLLLAGPIIFSFERRPLLGLAISAVAAIALLFIPPILMNAEADRLVAKERGTAHAPQKAGRVTSITIPTDGCGSLCERLLLGGSIETVRLTSPTQEGAPNLMFQRLPAADCQSLDPEFPSGQPCLLARPDDGQTSDLVVTRLVDGRAAPGYEDLGFSPKI